MKNHYIQRILLIVISGMFAACSPQIRVYSDFDPSYDVSSFKSFDWGQKANIEEGKNPLHYNELNDKRIKAVIREQLENRGYNLSESNPDIIIHYHIIVDDQSVVVPERFGYRYSPYWTQMSTQVHPYREGTLIVDLMDPKTNNLVWRGWAKSEINSPYKIDEIQKLIKQTVTKIFKKFPGAGDSNNESNEMSY